MCDTAPAWQAPAPLRAANWRLRGHRPTHLRAFSQRIVEACRRSQPRWLLATGLAPLDAAALRDIGVLGVTRLNFLTDDPWNPAQRGSWLLDALPHYDRVFSPRHANLNDLRALGCAGVAYLPFAYDPDVDHPAGPSDPGDPGALKCDVLFAGGADSDRAAWVGALIEAGLDVGLYGGYWERYPATRGAVRGMLRAELLPQAAAAAAIALCLVRRANRDGHAMRSYEMAAMGACLLAEDTEDHRELYGSEGEAALYFSTVDDLLQKARRLLADADLRGRMRRGALARVTSRPNKYADRLRSMLEAA